MEDTLIIWNTEVKGDAPLMVCPFSPREDENFDGDKMSMGGCNGSQCMMWRWISIEGEPLKGNNPFTRGYCALAGHPNTRRP